MDNLIENLEQMEIEEVTEEVIEEVIEEYDYSIDENSSYQDLCLTINYLLHQYEILKEQVEKTSSAFKIIK